MAKYIELQPMLDEIQGMIDNINYNYPYASQIELEVRKGQYEAIIEYLEEQPTIDIPFGKDTKSV